MQSWGHLTALIRARAARTVTLDVERAGETLTVPVTLTKTERPSRTDSDAMVDAGCLGVEPT